MTRWTSDRVARALAIPPVDGAGPFRVIATDTRRLRAGDLFVALKGERFDAHDFLESARDAGAAGAVVVTGTPDVEGLPLYRVADTRSALGRLARARRDEISGPVIAITGTNGKTSTKEMVAAVVGARYRVHKTAENLNNEIGVPMTLLDAPDDTEALVVEVGASAPGEIARMREVVAPTIALVTNVSAGHVAGFGSLEAILEEKISLLRGAPLAIVGREPPALPRAARAEAEVVRTAGLDAGADVHPDRWRLDAEGRVVLSKSGAEVVLPVVGRHQGENAMLALAVADALGIDDVAALPALAGVRLPSGRIELLRSGERVVLYDAYNANPASLRAALDTARAMRGDRPLVVLVGTMLELGAESAAAHQRLAETIAGDAPALVGAVGEFAPALERAMAHDARRLVTAPTAEALGERIAPRLPDRAFVLVKASRGVHFERLLPYLLPDREVPCSTTS